MLRITNPRGSDRMSDLEPANNSDSEPVFRLFVYGTLAPGRANHDVLAKIPGTWETAILKGRLHNEGWGSDMGCPGIVPAEDGEEVEGHVLASPKLSAYWAELDAFEGSEFE